MKRQVLKMIEDYSEEVAAEEISEHFSEFIKWSILNTGYSYKHKSFVVLDDDRVFKLIEDLYSYWLKEVNK